VCASPANIQNQPFRIQMYVFLARGRFVRKREILTACFGKFEFAPSHQNSLQIPAETDRFHTA
jgi:hypothetical protein